MSFSEIEKIVVKKPSFWNGKCRFHGTGDFKTWFSSDFRRYRRDKIFFAFIRNKWWRIGFTVEDSAAVIKFLQKKGLLLIPGQSPETAKGIKGDGSLYVEQG